MKSKALYAALFSIAVAAVSWITNFGIFRMICTMCLVPFAHAVIVFSMGAVIARYEEYGKLVMYNRIFNFTYIISNVMAYDTDNITDYMFFGLIHNDFLINIGFVISAIALTAHVVLLVLQIIEIRHTDKKR